ncbi:MAG: hypothetical protein ACR2HX_24095 [Pyrinomonadaceae bacterium]
MSKQTHNDQTLTRYLLGALLETEAERLDELSFTDDEFAEALKAAEKDLVDSYVQGELAGATLERFQSHYLASPLGREKVKFARAFQLVAEKSAATKASESGTETQDKSARKGKGSWRFFSLGFLAAPRPALRWGAALATLALIVAVGWLALENARLRRRPNQTEVRRQQPALREQELQRELEDRRPRAETELELARVREEGERLEQELKKQESQRQQRATGQPTAPPGKVGIASFILAPQMRDAGQIREVTLPPDAGSVVMQLMIEPNDFSAYRVALINQTGNQIHWRSGKLRARATGDDHAVSVSFRAGLLKPQTVYLLRVTGVSSSDAPEIIGDYPFRVK